PAAAEETAPSVAAAATSRAADLETYEVDGLILLGVLQGRDASHALVRVPDLGVVKVRQGDQLKDWRVFAIGDDHLRLRNDRGSRLLRLPSAAE
ncbi:MAG: pilus assembly protein PilP, partial [Pseudomonadota bacterium]